MARSPKPTRKPSQLRIIGGRWRGRKLRFTPAQGLRPTTDRVRETLFNWLAPVINGANCLDLFAGSGALGLEALSRGAARCDFVDTSAAALRQIESHLDILQATNAAACHLFPASQYLTGADGPYDIVFIDPPFGQGLIAPSCAQLAQHQLLAAGAMVYVECASEDQDLLMPPAWSLHREKVAGGVSYRLFVAEQYPQS